MKKTGLLLVAFLLFSFANTFAHALWIETPSTGKKGVEQEVKVFFGEFSDNDITPTDKWFSDLKDFTLILHTPDNKEIRLTQTAKKEYFSAVFTPNLDGVYTITMHHIAKEVYYGYKLDYNSSAIVQVGKITSSESKNNNLLGIASELSSVNKKDTKITFKSFVDQSVTGEKEIEVIAPNGWMKKVYPDDAGKANFTPIWPGKYMVEMIIQDKKKGTFNDKEFEVDFHCATFIIEVK